MLFFDAVNQLGRDTPWAHGAVLPYDTFGMVLFGALLYIATHYPQDVLAGLVLGAAPQGPGRVGVDLRQAYAQVFGGQP